MLATSKRFLINADEIKDEVSLFKIQGEKKFSS